MASSIVLFSDEGTTEVTALTAVETPVAKRRAKGGKKPSQELQVACLEVFEVEEADGICDNEGKQLASGWYSCYAFEGCVPHTPYLGPFGTEDEARHQASGASAVVPRR